MTNESVVRVGSEISIDGEWLRLTFEIGDGTRTQARMAPAVGMDLVSVILKAVTALNALPAERRAELLELLK